MQFEEIKELINEHCPTAILSEDLASHPNTLEITKDSILPVCQLLHENEKTYFDALSCLTGLDNGSKAKTMEVIYNLYSIPYDLHLALKVILDREKPEIESVTSIWKAADWHERESYDLLGITFGNHPDLRRILLPADWEGHPLKKDYEEQEFYHDIKVKY
ncbi:MAG: NADH-quinone oxidoreductase subunit C [Ekhidna sp.]|nr:NADH-quinone oxidoreductase subunit C [Ekhidna sp.]MBC6427613.1 NADH-quinone oxidoreductase subunit C [Ekhidna sp.]